MNGRHRIWLGLGANLADPVTMLEWVVARLASDPRLEGVRASRIWRGAYVGPGPAQPDYWNCCVAATTALAPLQLLALVRDLEREAGRPDHTHLRPRVLDIDVLLFDTLLLECPDLVLPHPRMRERRFVLEPLAELDPDLVLPPDGTAVAELLARPEIRGQDLEPVVAGAAQGSRS